MPVGASGGTPQYSGTFVHEVWSTKMLVKFWEALTMASIANADYAIGKGQGDTMIIRTIPTVTIGDYAKNMELPIQYLESPNVELTIEHAKYFAFACDDIDFYQTNLPLLNEFSAAAGKDMKVDVETDIYADIPADAHADNAGATAGHISANINLGITGTPLVVTTADVLNLIVRSMQCLGELNAPSEDRWGIIPGWMNSNILLSDLKDASLSGDGTSILRNGRKGRIADCTIYDSNILDTASDGGNTCFYPLFGQKRALTFCANLDKVEKMEPSKSFQKGIKGLTVYGYAVLKSECLVAPYVREGA